MFLEFFGGLPPCMVEMVPRFWEPGPDLLFIYMKLAFLAVVRE